MSKTSKIKKFLLSNAYWFWFLFFPKVLNPWHGGVAISREQLFLFASDIIKDLFLFKVIFKEYKKQFYVPLIVTVQIHGS